MASTADSSAAHERSSTPAYDDTPGGPAVFEPAPEELAAQPRRPVGRWLGLFLTLVALAAAGFAVAQPQALGELTFYLLGALAIAGLLVIAGLFAGLVRIDLRGQMLGDRLAAALAESAGDALGVTNDRGRLVYANQALLALSPGGAPRTAEAIFAGTDTDEEMGARAFRLARAARAGESATEDVAISAPDGGRRLVSVDVKPLDDSLNPGTVGTRYAVWRIADVTGAHERMEASEREAGRLSAYLDGLTFGVATLDREGRLLYLNDRLAGWLGLDRAGFTAGALTFDTLLASPRVPLGPKPGPNGNGANGDVRVSDADLKRKGDGAVMPVRLVERSGAMPAAGGESRPVTFVAVHDRRAGAQGGDLYDDAEVRFAHFFNNAPIGIVTVDADGKVVNANRAFADILHAEAEKGLALSALVAQEDRASLDGAIKSAANGEPAGPPIDLRVLSGEGEAQGGEGRVVQAYVSRVGTVSDEKSEGGKGPQVMVYFVDLTEQKTLEVQFAQSQKMQAVGQLAGGVAHDFNNLLTAIIGFCDLLLVRHQPGDPSFADVMQIKQNANRAANLVRQLLAFSRQQTLRPTVLNLTDALADLSNLLRRLLGETVDLQMVHGRELWPIKADQNQFEQVIINLAVNARDAMLEAGDGGMGGTLTIRTANVTEADSRALDHAIMPPGEYVLIEVSDTGCGIPKENLGKIFEPFFSTKEVGKGTGLGLSTVYGIVKQTGGYVFPFSTVGKGTSFRIYIPHHIETVEEKKAAEEPKKATDLTGKGTVLLVEDEDAVRSFAVRALQTRGYTVLEASSGEMALDVVEEFDGELDVVVSDVVMPNMDGPSMVRELNKVKPGLKIIFISGYAEDAFKKNLDKDVTFQFLPKPFSLKQLAAKVKEVIEEG